MAPALVAIGLAVPGCTDNFGTAPVDVGRNIPVVAEGPTGPSPRTAAILTLAGGDERLWVGLEKGLYRVDPGTWRWLPGHGGYSPEGGPSTPRRIVALDVDPSGRLAIEVTRLSGPDLLFASVDGGATFRELSIPNVIIGQVDVAAVLPSGTAHPDGAFLVSQGAAVYVQSTREEWTRTVLPAAPRRVRTAAASGGYVVLGVEGPDGSPAVWRSEDGGATFAQTSLTDQLTSEVLDVAIAGDGRIGVATPTGLVTADVQVEPASGTFTRVDLRFLGDRLRYAGLTDAGMVDIGEVDPLVEPLVVDAPANLAALLVTAGGVIAASGTPAVVWQLDGTTWTPHAFEGRSIWLTALAADPRAPGAIYLGHFQGQVFFEKASGEVVDLGSGRLASTCTTLLPDPQGLGVFSGSYGVQVIESNQPGAPWLDRWAGQSGVLDPTGPVVAQVLSADPDDGQHLWLGSQLGDGPYESLNAGLLWTSVGEGLGRYDVSLGFLAVTQVRAFAFVGTETWMGTFRGGVWSLSPSRVWRQFNEGLPDVDGAVLDTCCYDPVDPDDVFAPDPTEVDVRDLVVVDDGALLAATGWGVFRDGRRRGKWELSSNGLTNRDVFAFAVHPTRPGWVVAAARGNADNPDWLFLSRDGGRNWNPIQTALRARFAVDVAWSDPSALELVALLIGSGAWRMEIAP